MSAKSDKAAYDSDPDKFRDKSTKYRRNNPERVMVNNARLRANKAGIPCTITHEDVVIPTHCPLLGIPLDHTTGARHDGSPTLDKIRPELGYVPGNVRVVSWLANAVKRDLTPEQLLTFARNIGPYLS